MKFPMLAPGPMRPYYIAAIGMSLVVLLVVGSTVVGNINIKHDYDLSQKLKDAKSSIESHVTSNGKIPDTPLDAGIKEVNGYSYQKVSEEKYQLCADFRTRTSNSNRLREDDYDYDDNISLMHGVETAKNTKYYSGETEFFKHDKGNTCYVFTPQIRRSYPSNPQPIPQDDALCGKNKVRSPSASTVLRNRRIVTVSPAAASMSIIENSQIESTQTPTFVTFDSNVKVYAANCSEITVTSLKVGDLINLEQNGFTISAVRIITSTVRPQ